MVAISLPSVTWCPVAVVSCCLGRGGLGYSSLIQNLDFDTRPDCDIIIDTNQTVESCGRTRDIQKHEILRNHFQVVEAL